MNLYLSEHVENFKSRGPIFNIILIFILAFVIGVSISNVIYFSEISTYPSEAVSSNVGNIMVGLNIVILVITVIAFFYYCYLIFKSYESKFNHMEDSYSEHSDKSHHHHSHHHSHHHDHHDLEMDTFKDPLLDLDEF